jgi:CheY-like chemotaxis protein
MIAQRQRVHLRPRRDAAREHLPLHQDVFHVRDDEVGKPHKQYSVRPHALHRAMVSGFPEVEGFSKGIFVMHGLRLRDSPFRWRRGHGMRCPLIFVIDDHHDSAVFLARLLKLEGYQVAVYGCGDELLKRLHDPPPRLIILDHNMPGMSGIECVARIRALPQWATVPVIIFTADAHPSLREQALAAGAQHLFLKGSIELKGLLTAVRTLAGPADASQPGTNKSGTNKSDTLV